jgi:APA family basic amino acid/polyamine antiporter
MSIWSTKSVALMHADAYGERKNKLKRSLGWPSLTAFGVGSTIGAGIFVLTGQVAATHAGPAVTLTFITASIVCFFAGLCYAEFAAMAPVAGSAYSYAYATMGEVVAWIIGWCISLEYVFSASLVAISWSGYMTASLHDIGIHIPAVLSSAPLKLDAQDRIVSTGNWIDLPAVLVTLGCTVLLMIGTRQSSWVNNLIVAAKVTALVIVVIVGVQYINPHNWQPFIPANTGGFGNFGWSGVARGAAIVFFSYIGFDAVSCLAEESKNPQRTMPISLFASLAICTTVYVAVSLVITGMANYRTLDVADPLYFAVASVHGQLGWLKIILAVVAGFGLISVVLLSLLGQVRILYAMSRDGLLPEALSRTGGKQNTPRLSTLITGVLGAVMAGFLPLDLLTDVISIGTLMAFAIVCLGIPILRRTNPDAKRPFRTPWVPLIPILGIVSCILLMFSLSGRTWLRFALWLLIGLAIYFSYGYRHSRLRKLNEAAAGKPAAA